MNFQLLCFKSLQVYIASCTFTFVYDKICLLENILFFSIILFCSASLLSYLYFKIASWQCIFLLQCIQISTTLIKTMYKNAKLFTILFNHSCDALMSLTKICYYNMCLYSFQFLFGIKCFIPLVTFLLSIYCVVKGN